MRDPADILMTLFALIIAIPIHEFAHARSAVSYGDDTPARDGRLTIFPWTHFEPVGATFMVLSSIFGMGIGWGRPVMVRPENFRNPRLDDVKCAAWGPFSNFLLAIGFALPLRFGWIPAGDPLQLLMAVCVHVNLALMCFNLIPIYPLDGSHVLRGLLPTHLAYNYHRFMMQWGMMIMMLLILAGRPILTLLVGIPSYQLTAMLIGVGG
jgi:Zn-dependent protease